MIEANNTQIGYVPTNTDNYMIECVVTDLAEAEIDRISNEQHIVRSSIIDGFIYGHLEDWQDDIAELDNNIHMNVEVFSTRFREPLVVVEVIQWPRQVCFLVHTSEYWRVENALSSGSGSLDLEWMHMEFVAARGA